MTRFSRLISMAMLALAAVLSVGFTALPVVANSAPSAATPLVVIRFNQPNVYYALQLHGAITKAVETKPSVMIDVVSLAPLTGDGAKDKQWQSTAGRNTRGVIAAMKEMGVPAERISVKGESRPGLDADETQIFVR